MRRLILPLVLAVLFVAAVFQVESTFYLHMVIITGLATLTAASLNVVYGFAGQISLGHVAFYGLGAYVAAILTVDHGWSPWWALIVAPIICFVAGALIAIPAFRTAGIYFSIVTLAVGVITHIVMVNWVSVTRGAQGMPGVPQLGEVSLLGWEFDLGDRRPFALFVWALVAAWSALCAWLLTSRIGAGWIGVRENERLARSVGFPSHQLKVLAHAVSSAGAGLAGALLAYYLGIVSPASFAAMESLMILVVVVVGGAGRLWGPILGAVLLTALPEWLRFADELRLVLFGVVLLAIVMFLPQGLAGGMDDLATNIRGRLGRASSRNDEPTFEQDPVVVRSARD